MMASDSATAAASCPAHPVSHCTCLCIWWCLMHSCITGTQHLAAICSHAHVSWCACRLCPLPACPDLPWWPFVCRWLGVSKFYIYDNNSTLPAMLMLWDYMQEGIVDYQYFLGEAPDLGCGACRLPVRRSCLDPCLAHHARSCCFCSRDWLLNLTAHESPVSAGRASKLHCSVVRHAVLCRPPAPQA